ncbi:hypothetical protein V2W30_09560 [Streptomyces sp. Q6]|uniref:Uncharacterized protein n=1 Tax=Streptomyces citrinus TaxID=3118173 RepID=A0ACD5A8K3_9ACTN
MLAPVRGRRTRDRTTTKVDDDRTPDQVRKGGDRMLRDARLAAAVVDGKGQRP